jgi:hypothetical protein
MNVSVPSDQVPASCPGLGAISGPSRRRTHQRGSYWLREPCPDPARGGTVRSGGGRDRDRIASPPTRPDPHSIAGDPRRIRAL